MGSKLGSCLALLCLFMAVAVTKVVSQNAGSKLQMYVDELPKIPKIKGYQIHNGVPKPRKLTIGMYHKKWKFHRDLPESEVFVYGKRKRTATFPGPTIEAMQGVTTYVKWVSHLPKNHILPWDPTIPTAIAKKYGGVPAVVHLHGGVHEPQSDGSAFAWFTAGFKERGPIWSKSTYTYPNVQHPGNLWYHDHALGLTRENLLAGLLGPYVIKNHTMEAPFNLPSGPEFDRFLIIADRSFNTDGSIYMNRTGNNPNIHPQWQPEYFGDAITVNGKAWPFLKVQRRKYRFRIINVSNARYLHLALSNAMNFTVVGSDTTYLNKPVTARTILLSPAESFDVIIDFSAITGANTNGTEIEVTNDAPYPYPNGTAASIPNSRVMKFVVEPANHHRDNKNKIPSRLMNHTSALEAMREAKVRRFIVMYEYTSSTGEVTHLYINGKRLLDPVTETPRVGSTEVWEVINLTGDNHPLHLHLVSFQATKVRLLNDLQNFTNCMTQLNDAVRCNVDKHATGKTLDVPEHEKAWKNIVKIEPGTMTTIVVKFRVASTDDDYPFDATADPGYLYHCHILDHEDNEMIRPLKLVH